VFGSSPYLTGTPRGTKVKALPQESIVPQLRDAVEDPLHSGTDACPDRKPRLRVFMMDLLSVVAYYDAYLCQALQSEDISVSLGAITYHLDRSCFDKRAIKNDPGLLDLVGRFTLPTIVRQTLKVLEMSINLLALAIRFLWSPPDVVHVQYLPMLERHVPVELWFLRLCKRLGSALVCTVHDILPHDSGEVHVQSFQRAYGMMDAVICHSDAVKEQLIAQFNIEHERVWVIPHGPFFFEPSASAAPAVETEVGADVIVLCQGWIRPYKGIEFLLDSWEQVQRTGVKARLIIAGSGEPGLLNVIREKVSFLGLNDSVELSFRFQSVDEMLACYKSADIVVYPYKAITTSGALMTGITQRKAIVATSLPLFREVLQHGKNALLCSYGDTAQLASALLSLIRDPVLRHRLARETATLSRGTGAWQEIAAQTKSCYSAICSLTSSRAIPSGQAGREVPAVEFRDSEAA